MERKDIEVSIYHSKREWKCRYVTKNNHAKKGTIFSNTLRANVKNMRTFVPTPTPPAKFITTGGEGAKTYATTVSFLQWSY